MALTIPVQSITGPDGKALPFDKPGTKNCTQVVDPEVSHGVASIMTSVLTGNGTGAKSALAGGRIAAGKTGTTDKNNETWFVGYTPQLTTAVWVGTPLGNSQALDNIALPGGPYKTVFGASIAAPTWKAIMDYALAGQPNVGFPAPSDKVSNGDKVDFGSVAGQTVANATNALQAQGFTVLEMLNLIEPLELGPFLGPDHVHLLVQAKQIAYHDRDRWLADPRFAQVPTERLISKEHANQKRALLDRRRALPWDKVPSYGSLTGDTVYVAAVDAQGNAASLIFSLYGVFGSCVTSAETGVVLQNRAAYFSLDPKHPNCLEPGKVPLHTLIASLAFKDEKLWAVLGCMGADGQPQIHLQTYVAMIDFGQDIQQALAGPRWLSGRFGLGEARDTLHIEARYPRETIDELERRGHPVDRWGDWNELAGHAHGITRDARTGLLAGGFDPRSDGAAIGF